MSGTVNAGGLAETTSDGQWRAMNEKEKRPHTPVMKGVALLRKECHLSPLPLPAIPPCLLHHLPAFRWTCRTPALQGLQLRPFSSETLLCSP